MRWHPDNDVWKWWWYLGQIYARWLIDSIFSTLLYFRSDYELPIMVKQSNWWWESCSREVISHHNSQQKRCMSSIQSYDIRSSKCRRSIIAFYSHIHQGIPIWSRDKADEFHCFVHVVDEGKENLLCMSFWEGANPETGIDKIFYYNSIVLAWVSGSTKVGMQTKECATTVRFPYRSVVV